MTWTLVGQIVVLIVIGAFAIEGIISSIVVEWHRSRAMAARLIMSMDEQME
jgi:hypothetical protein